MSNIQQQISTFFLYYFLYTVYGFITLFKKIQVENAKDSIKNYQGKTVFYLNRNIDSIFIYFERKEVSFLFQFVFH